MMGSGWQFQQNFLATVEDGLEGSVGRRSGWKWEGSEEAIGIPSGKMMRV